MTIKQIENIILKNLADRAFPVYLINYMNRGFNEADVFGISGAGMMYEFEIKISRSDFLSDFKNKHHKHQLLSTRDAMRTYSKWKRGKMTDERYELICLPNKFYYACPVGLIKENELPDYAGLIYIDAKFTEIKPAPVLHHYKANEIIYKNVATILSQRSVWGCAYRSYKLKPQRDANAKM